MAKETKGKAAAPAPIDWSKFGATGFENTRTEDLGIPFLIIVQKGSPEVDKTHADYKTKRIEGAEVGSIVNTVTREIVGGEAEAAIFIPCSYERAFVEWKPRDTGGGFVRQHASDSILATVQRGEDNRDYLPNGNVIVTTAYFFGMLVKEDGATEKCVISMTSTQLKKARLWLNMAMQLKVNVGGEKIQAPLFSHRYALTTVPEQNQDGSWMGWHVETDGMVSNPKLIEECATVAQQQRSRARLAVAAPKAAADDVPM